tara:strand:+ start:5171 stop:5542 length:372 start_codon:yes stop_codon:yes gene_type:complete
MDYGLNNLLFKDNKVVAILDWEMSRIGDPAEEIYWTQNNLQAYSMPEFLQRYNRATGRNVTDFRVTYARIIYAVILTVSSLTIMRQLEEVDGMPMQTGLIPFKFMALVGADFDALIAKAEALK